MKAQLLAGLGMAALAAGNLFAVEADIDGASPGKWTMDLEAAKKVASEKKLPILLDFSGSDWCSWCQLMESNVFMKAEFQTYASNNIMLVLIDFPRNKSLVPEKYVERNDSLSRQYGIEGFPTYVILDDDGTTELGRLQAGEDKTPGSFIAELKNLFRTRPAEISRFADTLDPEQKAAYEELKARLEQNKQLIKEQEELLEAAQAKLTELHEARFVAENQMESFRMKQLLSEEDYALYADLKGKYDAAIKKLNDWIATQPERTEENMQFYQAMIEEIEKLQEQLSKY